jgi:hypothetical protein
LCLRRPGGLAGARHGCSGRTGRRYRAATDAAATPPGDDPADAPDAPDKEVLEQSGEGRGDRPPEEKTAVLFTGIGLSQVTADFSNLSDAVNLDLAVGAHVPVLTWLSGEIDFSFTIAPGENQGPGGTVTTTPCVVPPSMLDPDGTPNGCGVPMASPNPEATTSTNDLQMTNVGVFAALRTPGKVYVLGKYGYRYINCSIDEIQDGDDQAGTAYAAGAGYRFSPLTGLELAYTKYSGQLDYWGFNVAYGFGASPEPKP